MRSRLLTTSLAVLVAVLAGGADGCASDPNVEGAKLDLRNKDYDRALENVETALQANPDNTEALILKVEILRQQYEDTPGEQPKAAFLDANYDDMVATVRRAQQIAPGDASVDQAALAVWALGINQGNTIIRSSDRQPAEAIPFLQAANELVPDSTQGYLSLGLAYLSAGDATQALPVFERGARLAPDNATFAYYYGRTLIIADRPSEAITYLEDAQTRFPEDADIQTMLLNAYTAAGQTDLAIDRYAQAVVTQPDNPTIRYNYGALLIQAERYDEAIEQLQTATRLAPDNVDAFYNLGAAYQNRAAALNEQANATTNVDEANELLEQRNENLEMALGPLEEARTLAAGQDGESGVCEALFRVYTQLNRIDDAEGVAACAGISMN